MPYQQIYVPPELLLTHNGVNIFHTYKNDNVEEGQSTYWYTAFPLDDGEAEGAFDVRGLGDDRAARGIIEEHIEIIKAALDRGDIEIPDDLDDNAVPSDDRL